MGAAYPPREKGEPAREYPFSPVDVQSLDKSNIRPVLKLILDQLGLRLENRWREGAGVEWRLTQKTDGELPLKH